MSKIKKLKQLLKSYKSVLIAFSGGLDSTFLLKVARDTLGSENVLAVTAKSETYPESEMKEAVRLAEEFGARHKIINTSELRIKGFSENTINRCYYCKSELFTKLKALATKEKINAVLDGTNKDDENDFRPGARAKREKGVKSPLQLAGIRKEEIRKFSRRFGLSTWDKPAYACLASRFPTGTKITKPELHKVEKAEEFIKSLGFKQVRVRYHEDTARIEIDSKDIKKFLNPALREKISKALKNIGFRFVSLDLGGYKTGSMNSIKSSI